MMEITEEIRAWIKRNAGTTKLDADEYIDAPDGLIHCKNCKGSRQTIVPNFGKPGYLMPRCICGCQIEAERRRKEADDCGEEPRPDEHLSVQVQRQESRQE